MEKYLVSARKYRPSTFASVVGQKALTVTLKNAVKTNRLAHAYLFCGSRGVGKTSCARIFAKTINCSNLTPDGEACNECESCRAFNESTSMNIIELDAASNNGVDDMRQLIEQVQVPPSSGRYRVFIVDEVHMLSPAAFNAFLKTLEEPPSYVIFILATTEKHKIIPTILSRCQIYDFHRITIQDMIDHLTYVASQEGIQVEPAALNVIAQKADGAMRDALSIFDQVAASSGGVITYQSAIDNLNVLDHVYYHRILEALLQGDILGSWAIYKEIRDNGFDSQFFINGLASYMRDLMVAANPATLALIEAGDDARREMAEIAPRCKPEFLYRAMSLLNDADLNYRVASNKQFLIELTLAKICQPFGPSPSNDGEGEGRLKPIAVRGRATSPAAQPSAAKSPAPSPQPATPTPKPASTTVRPAQPTTASPAPAAPPRRLVGVSGPRISIRHGVESQADKPAEAAPVSQNRSHRFSTDALMTAWNTYISTNPTARILTNTMRAAPIKMLNDTQFTVLVRNQKQSETMLNSKQDLLRFLRDKLMNDSVDFNVEIDESSLPRYTLNDAELLKRMVNDYPPLEHLIRSFKLRLS
ncbi:MAG: DNA polymerase III subunit gamma/tau [Bacteroides sp.]|nr:DNA polymerase III subunit gamma/tau [Bacteroides sp.]MCM1413959.1 DNA polymerase III subunit gamma/tau [Bacteroides sp.]MCM1471824.1 DNA polymerase III subunit gamma/tau [Bacteroides sp.]